MIQWLQNIFNSDKKSNAVNEHTEDLTNQKKMLASVHGKYESFYTLFDFPTDYVSKRKTYMTKNMDELIHMIKKEVNSQPLLTRTIANITGKISNTNYSFKGLNKDKIKKVEYKFAEIIKSSNYNDKVFFKTLLLNLVKYSNSFLIPFKDKNEKLQTVLIVQNIGWHVFESIGTCYCKKFDFEPPGTNLKRYENQKDVWHYTYNRESDEIFAMPVWIPVLPFLKKYNYLLSSSIDSYSDQSIQRTIYEIGVTKNGAVRKVNVDTHDMIARLLRDTDDDIIVDTPVNANVVGKTFTSPDKILDVLENQIVAGLFTSKGQLGSSSTGRQDAETQDANTLIVAEDFLHELEVQLNQTLIKHICIDLFGDYLGENEIELKFDNSFDLKERQEKHAVYLFQSGITDLDETRKTCGLEKDELDKKKTFFELYQQTEMQGQVSSTNNPQNQHTSGTGTTKKTKKDNKRGQL